MHRIPAIRFFSLPQLEKSLFIEALWLFTLARIITLFPMRVYKNWVTRFPGEPQTTAGEDMIPALKKTISRIRKYYLPDASCLVKSIVAKKILSRRGIKSTLYIGVKKEEKKLSAHSWLMYGNECVTDGSDLNQYTVLTTL